VDGPGLFEQSGGKSPRLSNHGIEASGRGVTAQ
jgi:hypothetical protein